MTETGGYLGTASMPVKAKSETKREVDAAALASMFKSGAGALIVMERQHAFPGQGVSSVFSLGDSSGVVRGVCAALGLALEYVEPSVWKKYYGLWGKGKTKDAKELARSKAINLYPMAPLSRKKDEGLAESLLIARWYALTHRQS